MTHRSGETSVQANHIVVGYGREGASEATLEVASDLARQLRAHLHVVHALDLADYPIDPDRGDWEDAANAAVARKGTQVQAALDGHVHPWTYHVERGRPVDLLAAVADANDALMVIVGSRGGGPITTLSRFMSGSISRGLIHRCGRPVLVVPPHETSAIAIPSSQVRSHFLFRHRSS
jgi:nucleotide-binding universal stress UspA family protein